MKRTAIYITSFIILLAINLHAQKPSQHIKRGNQEFAEGQYTEAEALYRRALETPNKWEQHAMFNLGNALYKQGKYEDAEQLLQLLSQNQQIKNNDKAQVYHNLGNAQVKQQKFKESIQSYIEALKIQPNDEDTRYNLSYAMKMLQQQQENQDNNQDNQEENEDNQDQKEDKNEQQNNDNQEKEDNKQPEQQKQQQQLSAQDMERILNALSNKDKQTLEELREQQIIKTEIEKDW